MDNCQGNDRGMQYEGVKVRRLVGGWQMTDGRMLGTAIKVLHEQKKPQPF